MSGRDPHSALKSDIVGRANQHSLEIVLARLQWGKDDIAYSLHVNPTSFSTAGLQTTDFLAYLGFSRHDQCSFTSFHRCYARSVDEGFDAAAFPDIFNRAFRLMDQAARGFEGCGFLLPQPEGWGFFQARTGGGSRALPTLAGDGHTARQARTMKQTDDENFAFRFTFVETDHGKGFITHYRPKHLPLSSEVSGVFNYLGLTPFAQCPAFEFEPCYYRTLRFESRGDSPFDSNTEYAHRGFDAHATRFSPSVRDLLAANVEIEKSGLTLLPLATPAERLRADIAVNVVRPGAASRPRGTTARTQPPAAPAQAMPNSFDVAISFAGTERDYARQLAEQLKAAGFSVFYDDFYPDQLWGKNLTSFFDEVFRKRARFCVVFISQEYRDRKWTIHEVRSAQARALEEKGKEYILPVRVDASDLDGLLPTLGYVPIDLGIEKIGDLLIKKLRS